ncbi:site-specific DNA-methyltransferase [Pseudomonas sp. CCI1.1]|uniref:site-specific DNA-methyltransferase n=1 Tax=Pseudomonas sp. CCI1.1 TaxID=3048613 RepID=UPI002AC9DF1C|nr:site-specific DNA-methyltransferase [Pseudomonas sp. CCI1.1]MEB0189738.1 site-specific DNA-methyltransferase [Pseudomonas sp. CCI1.1]WPX45902.1 site-specific DNA-methyltransferase [Pseudomonas sp. CCI1.1]
MAGKTKLELTWIGKDERPRLEPRILIEDPEFSYHAETRREGDHFDNMLIHGDNLLALKALETEPNVRGKVKCIFIDPPYNTGSAFEHYDDGIEHSLWLTMMRDRIELLYSLLAEDGSMWVTIDDNEAHYFKVICDEVFGRSNFVANAVWQKKYTVANDAKWLSDSHDHVIIYAKNKMAWRPNRLPRTSEMDERYRNPDNHPKGPWKATPLYAKRTGSEKERAFSFQFKNGFIWTPPRGTSPRFPADTLRMMDDNDEIWFGVDGTANPSRKTFLSELKISGTPASTLWLHSDVGHNHEARDEVKAINPDDPFDTPKPERLIKRILELATTPGDLVLDSFGGSGTTGAVAHKMGRRWIMVELGEHAKTHIVPRMQNVINGTDKVGVTGAVNWQGGGGYRFFQLAPSLLQKDKWGNLVINKDYQPEMLAEAICKHFNYTYAPSTEHYWMHGKATENAFIYVTTNSLTIDQLKTLSDEVGEERSLLVCCMAYEAAGDNLTNLTIKKIPRVVLDRCEWGKDDYSLKIAALPMQDEELEAVEITAAKPKKNKASVAQANLFDSTEEN